MPLKSREHWERRFGESNPNWSGDRWLDIAHGRALRSGLKRIWPDDASRVLDVGAGDGRVGRWVKDRMGVKVRALDEVEFPSVRARLGPPILCDAERMHWNSEVRLLSPDMVMMVNSLTCTMNWRQMLSAAFEATQRYVLVLDNLQTPTPEFRKGLPHVFPVELPELVKLATRRGASPVVRMRTVDVFHRRMFLKTPKWVHPAVCGITIAGDLAAQRVLTPIRARHVAVLFEKET